MENGLTPKSRRLLEKLPFIAIHLDATQWRTSGTESRRSGTPSKYFRAYTLLKLPG